MQRARRTRAAVTLIHPEVNVGLEAALVTGLGRVITVLLDF